MLNLGEAPAASNLAGKAATQPLGTGKAPAVTILSQTTCRNFRCQ
jgi:hypothetical protein